jgi:hypothetical protein
MSKHHPYSVPRLLNMIRGHDFSAQHDFEFGEDYETGEPHIARAWRRVREVLRVRREERDFGYEPQLDEEKAEFHVCDIALLWDELRHLARLKEKLVLAVGPPCTTRRYNKKTRKMDDMGSPDDFGE